MPPATPASQWAAVACAHAQTAVMSTDASELHNAMAICPPTGHTVWKHDVIRKARSILYIITPLEEEWAMATGNYYYTSSSSSFSGILLFSRSLTPITATHHKHLSSARFFAVSYPSHMLLVSCNLFLPLIHFPVILPSRLGLGKNQVSSFMVNISIRVITILMAPSIRHASAICFLTLMIMVWDIMKQESCAIAKMTTWGALYRSVLKVFETPWLCIWTLFPNCFDALLFWSTLWMRDNSEWSFGWGLWTLI